MMMMIMTFGDIFYSCSVLCVLISSRRDAKEAKKPPKQRTNQITRTKKKRCNQ